MKIELREPLDSRGAAELPCRAPAALEHLDPDHPAIAAMTDFALDCPLTVSESRHIDDALQDMIHGGVRALFVLREGRVTGLITSYDIQGERPMQFLRSSACIHDTCLHRDIVVGDIMTPWNRLPTLAFEDVCGARIEDVAGVFRTTDLMHLVVAEAGPGGSTTVRGLFSRTRLEKQLGIPVRPAPQAREEHWNVSPVYSGTAA